MRRAPRRKPVPDRPRGALLPSVEYWLAPRCRRSRRPRNEEYVRASTSHSGTRPSAPIRRWRGAPTSHTEDTEAGVLDGGVERGRDRESEEAPRVGRVDHAVVPQAGTGIVGMALALVLVSNRLLERLLVGGGGELPAHRGEHARGLLASHDRDARGGP